MKGNELKPHIGIFGRRNYGKSSLLNFLVGQTVAIVSDHAGTTTDPVKKTMEVGGVGPVVWIDSAGIDDEGAVGSQRVAKSLEVLPQVDLALILFTRNRFEREEELLVEACRKAQVPFLLLYSQTDIYPPKDSILSSVRRAYSTEVMPFSVRDPSSRELLLRRLRQALPSTAFTPPTLLGDVIAEGDTVVLVTPIDSSAPAGRMILPQVQVLRDVLDHHARAVVCREKELQQTLADLRTPPRLVVTDSQAYAQVAAIVPQEVFLTSFSVVLARAKGLFDEYVKGTPTIDHLKDGDRVLMLESCTHNVTCEDIGRVKLPRLLAKYTGKQLCCEAVAGLSALPRQIEQYVLVIQCGGCVLTGQQVASRLLPALQAGVPVSNYGLAIAYMNGIFNRSMRVFDTARPS